MFSLSNCIPNVDTVSFMGLCAKLSHLDLSGNPVCDESEYRLAIKEVIPSLKILDERAFYDPLPEQPSSLSSSEYNSSTATSLSDAKPCSSSEFAELTRNYVPSKLRLGSASDNSAADPNPTVEGWAPRSQSAGNTEPTRNKIEQ